MLTLGIILLALVVLWMLIATIFEPTDEQLETEQEELKRGDQTNSSAGSCSQH